MSRQVTEAFPWDTAPRYLLRDRDASYSEVFSKWDRREQKPSLPVLSGRIKRLRLSLSGRPRRIMRPIRSSLALLFAEK